MKRKSSRGKTFMEGVRGFKLGRECPYTRNSHDRRYTDWWSGYYHARTEIRLGRVFKKHGIEW